MADKFIQMAQRNTGNTDWDNLFPLGKFETAEGTATAITLTIPNLANGISKTFIASASNNSAATTINGKSLYKPNTTTAPTLIAGKAYTVWYSASNDCFFIKASAEGDAVAGDVLAGKTFSNDEDVGLAGTMDLQAENIREGVNYAGIIGTLKELKLLRGSDYTLYESTSSEAGYSASPSPVGPKIVTQIGINIRITFNLYDDNAQGPVYGQIYKNDNPAGKLQSTANDYYTSFAEDFDCQEGDIFQLYLYTGSGQGTARSKEFIVTANLEKGITVE